MFRKRMSEAKWEALLGKISRDEQGLQTLNLSNCQVNDERLLALASALQRNNTVTNLILSGNSFTDKGARVIIKLLTRNDHIQQVDVSFNMISYDYQRWIKTMAEMNQVCSKMRADQAERRLQLTALGLFAMPENKLMQPYPSSKRSP